MYSGVLTNVPAFEQPATVSWLRYLLVVKGCGAGGVPRAGCCAAAPTTAVTTSTANPTMCFNFFTEGLLSVFAMRATIARSRGSRSEELLGPPRKASGTLHSVPCRPEYETVPARSNAPEPPHAADRSLPSLLFLNSPACARPSAR